MIPNFTYGDLLPIKIDFTTFKSFQQAPESPVHPQFKKETLRTELFCGAVVHLSGLTYNSGKEHCHKQIVRSKHLSKTTASNHLICEFSR